MIIFFLFNYYFFKYIEKILIDFNKNKLLYILVSLINTYLMILAYKMSLPYYISYFCVLFTLTIEFLMLSKAKFIQAFLCAGILVINISVSQLFFIPIFSYMVKVTPYELFNNPDLFFQSLSILFIILFIVFNVSLKFIVPSDIIKISTAPVYALMISSIIIFILIYTILDVIALQSEQYSNKHILVFLTTPILNGTIFYKLFFYSIKSVKMVAFKRKSDELQLRKIENDINKKHIEDKISKDDLTACYNRKYIMSDLKEKYENNIFNFAILFIDIDGLKAVNDTLGHEIGDEYIINVSNTLKESVRENDLIARLGGDEFLIIINDIQEVEVKYILDRISKKINILDKFTKEYKVSASIGSIFIDESLLKTGVDNIIKIADDEMRINKSYQKEHKLKC